MEQTKTLTIEAKARRDYIDGCAQDENPYPVGTEAHSIWQGVMDELYLMEQMLAANYYESC